MDMIMNLDHRYKEHYPEVDRYLKEGAITQACFNTAIDLINRGRIRPLYLAPVSGAQFTGLLAYRDMATILGSIDREGTWKEQ